MGDQTGRGANPGGVWLSPDRHQGPCSSLRPPGTSRRSADGLATSQLCPDQLGDHGQQLRRSVPRFPQLSKRYDNRTYLIALWQCSKEVTRFTLWDRRPVPSGTKRRRLLALLVVPFGHGDAKASGRSEKSRRQGWAGASTGSFVSSQHTYWWDLLCAWPGRPDAQPENQGNKKGRLRCSWPCPA